MAMLALSVLLLLATAMRATAQDCTWSTNRDLPFFSPLYIKPGGSFDIKGMWLPQETDVVTVATGDQVLFACPGGVLTTTGEYSEAILTCISNDLWRDESGFSYSFYYLGCSNYPLVTARYTGTPCDIPGPYSLIEIGYELMNGDFYTLLNFCYDPINLNSIYSVFLQTPAIKGRQENYPPPSYKQGTEFYPLDMIVETLYTVDSQLVAMTEAVGSQVLAETYIQANSNYVLTKGTLSVRFDFVYGVHQRTPYWFMNVAPQWQTIKVANWAKLENDVRKYCETYENNVFVYTGVHGTMTLADVNNVQVPIYLDKDSSGDGVLTVPHIFWKVMFDPTTGLGVAFAGLNNPYIDNPGSDFYLCPNVCDQLTWLTWSPDDQAKGYAYCCEVPALAAAVPEIPNLPVTGLLT